MLAGVFVAALCVPFAACHCCCGVQGLLRLSDRSNCTSQSYRQKRSSAFSNCPHMQPLHFLSYCLYVCVQRHFTSLLSRHIGINLALHALHGGRPWACQVSRSRPPVQGAGGPPYPPAPWTSRAGRLPLVRHVHMLLPPWVQVPWVLSL